VSEEIENEISKQEMKISKQTWENLFLFSSNKPAKPIPKTLANNSLK
jgi:hypothetical protein